MANIEYNYFKELVNKNITPYLQGSKFCEGKTKDGSTYYYISIMFKNGFEKRLFLNNSDIFGIKDAVNMIDKNASFKDVVNE